MPNPTRGDRLLASLAMSPQTPTTRAGDPHSQPSSEGVAAFRNAVVEVVARIPKGKLASYGQVALLAGYPQRPRQVGMVLRGLPEGTRLPWHRVVNTQGYVPSRGRWWGAMVQIQRLRVEGIPVEDDGTLDLKAHRWNPGEVKKVSANLK